MKSSGSLFGIVCTESEPLRGLCLFVFKWGEYKLCVLCERPEPGARNFASGANYQALLDEDGGRFSKIGKWRGRNLGMTS